MALPRHHRQQQRAPSHRPCGSLRAVTRLRPCSAAVSVAVVGPPAPQPATFGSGTPTPATGGQHQEPPGPAAAAALVRVANLASAWAKVARRLPLLEGESAARQVLTALRLAISCLDGAPVREDGRDPITRVVRLCVLLAELSAVGLPLDADALAACLVAEIVSHTSTHQAAAPGAPVLDHSLVSAKFGDRVVSLVHDILRVRTAPARTELLDDQAASALREWCVAFNGIIANVVEVVSRWDALQHMEALPVWERQQLAVESLQVWAPLGHALGLGAISANMEDRCFQVLFPESYLHTREWLRTVAEPAEDALLTAQEQLLRALEEHPRFMQLAAGCQMRTRTKSLFSIMKKLLRLGDMAKGGRRHDEVFDLLGMRAVVQPRRDLPPDEAERLATEACYVLQEVASRLWHVVSQRTKDYIRRPKASGYMSLHLTICMHSVVRRAAATGWDSADSDDSQERDAQQAAAAGECTDTWVAQMRVHRRPSASSRSSSSSEEEDEEDSGGSGVVAPHAAAYLELQVRTQAMDDRAETGDASHATYKGGLDAQQARLLHDWSRELHARLRLARGGSDGSAGPHKLLLPPSVVAQQVGAFTLLDSVDLDADVVQFGLGQDAAPAPTPAAFPPAGATGCALTVPAPPAASLLGELAAGVNGVGGSGSTAGRLGAHEPRGDGALGRTRQQQKEEQQCGLWRGTASSPYESLFRFMDRDGNGSISQAEWREQLQEMGVSAWAPARGGSAGVPAGGSGPLLHRGSPLGIITFDAAADAEAIDAWMRSSLRPGAADVPGAAMPTVAEPGVTGSALAQAPGLMNSHELSLQEFVVLLKQAGAVRDQQLQRLQVEQQ